MEDYTISSGEVESGDDGLEQLSPKLNWIQKILSSARMGGISGPLVRELFLPDVDFCHACCHCAADTLICCCSMSLFLHS